MPIDARVEKCKKMANNFTRPGGTGRAGRAWARPKIGSTTIVTTCFSFFFIGSVVEYSATVGFYPRDAMLERVFATATCLSVRLSVTRRYCA